MLKEYREEVDQWFREKGWEYWEIPCIIARLGEECGEVDRALNDIFGSKPKRSDEAKQDLAEEIGDVVYTLICLANKMDLNLDDIVRINADDQLPPMAFPTKIMIECGHLAEAIERDASQNELATKVANVVAVMMSLARATGVSFDAGMRACLDKVMKRDKKRYK